MNGLPREPIMQALKARLVAKLPEFNLISRRVKMYDDVNSTDFPCLFIVEPMSENVQGSTALPEKTTLDVDLWIYINAGKDPNVEPITVLNNLLDRIDAAFTPDLPDPFDQVVTLGGLVSHCWIEGKLEKDPGDGSTGVGLAKVPVKILVP